MADPGNVARGAITLRVGFTGTREGLVKPQRLSLINWLERESLSQFHHGCCVGADCEAAGIAAFRLSPPPHIVGHPPESESFVSEAALVVNDECHNPRSYLDRNHAIVDACDVLLACPKGPEERRSGTWATVRYGRKVGKRIVLFFPNGTVVEEVARVGN